MRDNVQYETTGREQPIAQGTDQLVALKVQDLRKSYGNVRAIDNVSLSVKRGAFFGIIGPNGSGKSTLVDCLSGSITDYDGTVEFNGRDISHFGTRRVARLGLLRTFQTSRLFERMSVLSNLMVCMPNQKGEKFFGAALGRWGTQQRMTVAQARDVLAAYGLSNQENLYASELSGGQRRLLELARLSVMDPKAVLLDEPFAGVSATYRAILRDNFRSLSKRGVTVVMIEHRLELVEELCDTIAVMVEGKLIVEGSMEEIRQDEIVRTAYIGGVGPDAIRM